MQKPTNSTTATAVSRRERKVGGGAAKKARTHKVKHRCILVSGEQASEKPGDKEASLNGSVEEEEEEGEEEKASTAALKDVTNTPASP